MAKTKKELFENAILNINNDRERAERVLEMLMDSVDTKVNQILDVAIPATKALETLQRSNEQLVKLASIKSTKEEESDELSSEEIGSILNKNIG
jgi:hypothetical protein